MSLIVLSTAEVPVPESAAAAWQAELPAERRAQLQRWPAAAARRSLLGNRLLRMALQRSGLDAAAAGLHYPTRGKPTLALPVDFSISHCEGWIVCALSTQGAVGIDIEKLGPVRAAEFRLYLSPRERAWAGDDPLRFYTLWTRKEAVAKAAGSDGLQQLPDIDASGATVCFGGVVWHTVPLSVAAGHAAQLASRERIVATPVERLDLAQLLGG